MNLRILSTRKEQQPLLRKRVQRKVDVSRLGMALLLVTVVVGLLPVSSFFSAVQAQTLHRYDISFDHAVHHEATIAVEFPNVDEQPLQVRMSRTSPGRYAIHNFAKNVYQVKAFDSQGNPLEVQRPNPQQWDVLGHDGFVRFEYTLFANRGDGTYSQVDESHAHLNIPATFVYARNYMHRPIELKVQVPEGSNWKVATQLKELDPSTFYAPNGYYFIDSPIEMSDYHLRERMVDGQLIQLALHTPASDSEVNAYFAKVMAIVEAQRDVFGELPEFDFGRYTFLSCYMPQASGDGMEHRNSTIVTNRKPMEEPLAETSIGTISHEFFHAWNVERIRPASLEPFDFEEANMSGALWFAEGFTSYYTNLILARAGIMTPEEYIQSLNRTLNYVMLSPGQDFFNPIEMSYRAPFVDAATAIDPDNNTNIFISYYSYGSLLGLALDLKLRTETTQTLDDYMRTLWAQYGKNEQAYTLKDLEGTLAELAGDSLAQSFFERHIYNSDMPDMKELLSRVGVSLDLAAANAPYLGVSSRWNPASEAWELTSDPRKGSPAYISGLNRGDFITSVAGLGLDAERSLDDVVSGRRVGQQLEVEYRRWGLSKSTTVVLQADPSMQASVMRRPSKEQKQAFDSWVSTKE
jgi:predicted metalloprotease with PDZ domain